MSHQVETMAFTNEVPWHGLGKYVAEAPNVKAMIKLAGLDWKVEKQPLFASTCKATGDMVDVEEHFALMRDKDSKVLDIVGNRYIPTQNHEALEFFTEFVEAGGATMETAGSLREGRYVWGLANLNAQFKMRGNDVVKGYLLVACPHQQGKSLIIRFTTVRVVCNNTLTLALSDHGHEFRMNHRNAFDAAMMARAKEALGIARDQLGEFERNARLLQKLKISRNDAIKILAPIYQPDAKVADLMKDADTIGKRLELVLHSFDKAPGAQPDNAYGLLNAVTYYSDHLASRSADKRLTNAWLGRTAKQKEYVLKTLIEMAQ